MNQELNNSFLVAFYADIFKKSGIQSVSQLNEALKQGNLNLSLNEESILPAEKQQEILRNNPDKITLGSKDVDLEYKYDQSLNAHSAKAIIDMVDIFEINSIPTIPSETKISIGLRSGGYERLAGYDLEQLKNQAEEYLLNQMWSTYTSENYGKTREKGLVAFSSVKSPLPEMPDNIVYGINPRSKQEAVAYPALTYTKSYWGSDPDYSIKYYLNREQADLESKKSKTRITLSKYQARIDNIYRNYEKYGLTFDQGLELNNSASEIEKIVDEDPDSANIKLESITSHIEEIENTVINRDSRDVTLDRMQGESPEESDFALAFKQAREKNNLLSNGQQSAEEEIQGPMSEAKKRKLEKELEETKKKLISVKFDLDIQIQQEKKKALNVTSGEVSVDISKKGTRVVANFIKEFDPGSYYAEVMDWSTGKVRRLVIDGMQGELYVETVEDIPGGDFHSEGLDIDGTSQRVKIVDLTENNPQIRILEEKIDKLTRRLQEKKD